MSDADLVNWLRSCVSRLINGDTVDGDIEVEKLTSAADRIEALAAEVERLRKVAVDCAAAIGNGAALSSESSLEFIELLPGEISKHTDKLRRFLKCSRDEGTEALDRAESAERAMADYARHEQTLRDNGIPSHSHAVVMICDLRRALAEAVDIIRGFLDAEVTPNGDIIGPDWTAARDFITAHEKEKP